MIKLIKTNKNKIKPGSKSHTIYTSYKHACNHLLATRIYSQVKPLHKIKFLKWSQEKVNVNEKVKKYLMGGGGREFDLI